MSVPFTTFSGGAVPRSSGISLFGEVSAPASSGGFPCQNTGGLFLQWSGTAADGTAIPLNASNQARALSLHRDGRDSQQARECNIPRKGIS